MISESIDLEDLLKQVSRSFYLTLRILPHSIKPQLGLAYLLARATDTVADTEMIPIRRRQEVLVDLRKSIQAVCENQVPTLPDFQGFSEAGKESQENGNRAERILLENFAVLLAAFQRCTSEDRHKIRTVLDIITQGQEMDLIRFGASSADQIVSLQTDEELDAYTYDVAGCVGEFWTRICRAHVFPNALLDEPQLITDAVRFGKGLQLVNILRDLPKDLRQGRCYIPAQRLGEFGLKPNDLLDLGALDRFRPLYDGYLQQAINHLRAGWRYTTALPYGCLRVRLACAWPILIGVKTIDRLRSSNVLDGRQRVKIFRSDIWRIITLSIFLYPIRNRWNQLL
jgi:farnesyl-diphosphate farnesyltransferase